MLGHGRRVRQGRARNSGRSAGHVNKWGCAVYTWTGHSWRWAALRVQVWPQGGLLHALCARFQAAHLLQMAHNTTQYFTR